MKKVLSILLCMLVLASLFSFTANAAGWQSYAKTVQLNSVFIDRFSEMDYKIKKSWYSDYFDVFKFSVPSTGNIRLHIESEKEIARYTDFFVYSEKNIDKVLWEGINDNEQKYGYSDGRGVYYDEWSFFLTAGTYYLVAEMSSYFDDKINVDCEYFLGFSPSFSNTSISKLTKYKKAFKVTWRNASGVTGYQIQYSQNSKMKSSKIITINNKTKVSRKIKGLKKKKKYYVRVRTYKKLTVEGVLKTYYGKWSVKKSIKTK